MLLLPLEQGLELKGNRKDNKYLEETTTFQLREVVRVADPALQSDFLRCEIEKGGSALVRT